MYPGLTAFPWLTYYERLFIFQAVFLCPNSMTLRRTIIFCALVLPLLLLGGLGLRFGLFLLTPASPAQPVSLSIPSGSSMAKVAELLQEQSIISDELQFRLLARIQSKATRIQAGDYDFAHAARPEEVLDRLVSGDVRRIRLTIPEGLTLKEIAEKIAETGLVKQEQIINLGANSTFIAKLGLGVPSLEGYLYPETYTLVGGLTAEQILSAMVRQFNKFLTPELIAAARKQNLSLHQLVTLASIIQKETGALEEMPQISSVFHNRLKRGMPLQSDPTVIYGIKDFDGNLTRKHLRQATPYNTYKIPGLPPGPIASPGGEALQAAAHPAKTRYLYFVARGDGTHAFSATLQEHNRAVRRYQLKR